MIKSDIKREVFRKLLHMGMGIFAFALRYLSPIQAAGCALVALAHNLWLFPHYGMKKLERPEEKARGYSGMLGYPFIVLILILLCFDFPQLLRPNAGPAPDGLGPFYRDRLAIAAGAWALLAFGDALGALCGIFLKGPALPWNGQKRWSGLLGFILFGSPLACIAIAFVSYSVPGQDIPASGLFFAVAIAAACSAIVESLPGQIDDNLTVPLMAWLVLSFMPQWAQLLAAAGQLFLGANWLHLGLMAAANLALGSTAYLLKLVDLSSYLLGLLFGFCVIMGAGPAGYCILVLFYIVSQSSTYYGAATKKARKIEEPEEGMRKTGSVFSKGFMPALFSLVSIPSLVAALSVYAADTVASEIGKTSKARAFSIIRMKKVEPGTVGAISWKGSFAGMLAILFFWSASMLVLSLLPTAGWANQPGASPIDFLFCLQFSSCEHGLALSFVVPVALLLLCFFLESVINEWNSRRGFFSKEIIHLFLGALAGMILYLPGSLLSLASHYFGP